MNNCELIGLYTHHGLRTFFQNIVLILCIYGTHSLTQLKNGQSRFVQD